jgi:hypothetical protein
MYNSNQTEQKQILSRTVTLTRPLKTRLLFQHNAFLHGRHRLLVKSSNSLTIPCEITTKVSAILLSN